MTLRPGRVHPDTPCVHCGLPIGPYPVGSDPFFCCTGCALVYATLQQAGMGDTYYRLRELTPTGRDPRPAARRLDELQLSELDSAPFIEAHSRPAGESARHMDVFLDGVHCAACVWVVEQMPYVLDGVHDARLDLPRARLSLTWSPEQVKLSDIAGWLGRFGYTLYPASAPTSAIRTSAERRLLLKLGIAWALAGNVMLLAFAFYSGLDAAGDPTLATAGRWMSFTLAAPAVLYGGSEFFRAAWASLHVAMRTRRLRSLHMDIPISLGILAGFLHSAWATVTGAGEIWFDSITVLIAALLTARWLQLRSRRLAGDATERLLALLPSMVRLVMDDGSVAVVRIDEIATGDLIEAPAGEVFPVDGRVEKGTSTVNNAVLTGESRPVPVEPDSRVQAGATNLSATLRIRVERTGDATRVGKLLAWIRSQEGRRAPVVLLADRLGGYFVLTVLLLAAGTALLWWRLEPSEMLTHVVALLVITCPCALGMATPLAMTVAAGQAARAGIFIKNDEATQQLAEIDTILLDKTGTLTFGRMTLAAYEGDEEAVDLAAALETESNHPIGVSLVQARGRCVLPGAEPEESLEVRGFEAEAGQGVRGWVDGCFVTVGRPDWVSTLSAPFPSAFEAAIGRYVGAGYTPVTVAVDGQPRAVLALGDRLRPSSADLVSALQKEGFEVYVVSGDHNEVARAVAGQLGIPDGGVRGDASPEDKQEFVHELRSAGKHIAMIGDGVNDAAALQAAHVGIAVQGGSSASMVAADVFLTRSGLRPVMESIYGARRVMRVVRRNLSLSLVYNLLGATAAIAGLVTPLAAAVAMPVSSLLVVASSVWQRSFTFQPLSYYEEDTDGRPETSGEPIGSETVEEGRSPAALGR